MSTEKSVSTPQKSRLNTDQAIDNAKSRLADALANNQKQNKPGLKPNGFSYAIPFEHYTAAANRIQMYILDSKNLNLETLLRQLSEAYLTAVKDQEFAKETGFFSKKLGETFKPRYPFHDALNSIYKEVIDAYSELEGKNSKLIDEYKKAEHGRLDALAKLNDAKDKLNSIEKIQNENNKLKEENEKLNAALEKVKSKNKMLKAELEKLKGEKQEVEKKEGVSTALANEREQTNRVLLHEVQENRKQKDELLNQVMSVAQQATSTMKETQTLMLESKNTMSTTQQFLLTSSSSQRKIVESPTTDHEKVTKSAAYIPLLFNWCSESRVRLFADLSNYLQKGTLAQRDMKTNTYFHTNPWYKVTTGTVWQLLQTLIQAYNKNDVQTHETLSKVLLNNAPKLTKVVDKEFADIEATIGMLKQATPDERKASDTKVQRPEGIAKMSPLTVAALYDEGDVHAQKLGVKTFSETFIKMLNTPVSEARRLIPQGQFKMLASEYALTALNKALSTSEKDENTHSISLTSGTETVD